MNAIPLLIALTNSADRIALECSLANEAVQDAQGWVKLSPYGDFPKTRSIKLEDGSSATEHFIQRVDKSSAEAMVRNFNSIWGKTKRFLQGTPVFVGHPDILRHQPNTLTSAANDHAPKGVVADIEARDDGFYAQLALFDEGKQAVENEGNKFMSPFWWINIIGQEGNVPIVSPTSLISVGLVKSPNIKGGDALANANNPSGKGEQTTAIEQPVRDEKKENMKSTIALLISLGCALANDADEAAINSAITTLGTKAKTADTLSTGKTALENEKNTATTERDQARTALANERNRAIDFAIQLAQAKGSIVVADVDGWKTALANEATFEAKLKELGTLPPKIKTVATVEIAGKQVAFANESDLTNKVIELVQERMHAKGEGYAVAFAAVQREQPGLFAAMKQPETK